MLAMLVKLVEQNFRGRDDVGDLTGSGVCHLLGTIHYLVQKQELI